MFRNDLFASCSGLAALALISGCGTGESLDGVNARVQAIIDTEVVDQQLVMTTSPGVAQPFGPSGPMAQTFTAGFNGKLSRVSLRASICYTAWEPYGSCWFTLKLKTVNGSGDPATAIAEGRAREPASADSGSSYGTSEVVFSTPATVQAGVQYALEITPDWWMEVPLGSGYGGGEVMMWQSGYNYWARYAGGRDLFFQTKVLDPYSASNFHSGDTNPDGVDWDYGFYKGGCDVGAGMIGLSRSPNSFAQAGLCLRWSGFSNSTQAVLELESGSMSDHRRYARLNDWDPYHYKLECGNGEYVSGFSQHPTTHALHGVRCATAASQTSTCSVRNVSGPNDESGGAVSTDWSPYSYKGQCSAGEYVVGVSVDTTTLYPHKILCCQG